MSCHSINFVSPVNFGVQSKFAFSFQQLFTFKIFATPSDFIGSILHALTTRGRYDFSERTEIRVPRRDAPRSVDDARDTMICCASATRAFPSATPSGVRRAAASVGRPVRGGTNAPAVSRVVVTSGRATSIPVVGRGDRARSRGAAPRASGGDGSESDADLPPVGFGSIAGKEGVREDRSEVPDSVKDDYRRVQDPEWLERELLRADDGYPTSRGAVLRQAFTTGDVKGVAYAISSVRGAVVLLALAYVSAAAARVGAEEGELLQMAGAWWKPLLLLGLASAAAEAQKFIESVIGVEGRRKM